MTVYVFMFFFALMPLDHQPRKRSLQWFISPDRLVGRTKLILQQRHPGRSDRTSINEDFLVWSGQMRIHPRNSALLDRWVIWCGCFSLFRLNAVPNFYGRVIPQGVSKYVEIYYRSVCTKAFNTSWAKKVQSCAVMCTTVLRFHLDADLADVVLFTVRFSFFFLTHARPSSTV